MTVLVEMMTAAGESDFEIGRIKQFESTCQMFSPIIFHLDTRSGFYEFENACRTTHKYMENCATAIKDLVSQKFSVI